MSLSYDLFSSLEAVGEKEPKTVPAAIETFNTYYKTFSEKAEEVSGRLYAMIKKLTSEKPVNTEIKYLKVRLLDNPSALVTRITERILEQVLFNEDVCKYDTKQLNTVISKRCCEQHVEALKMLLDYKSTIDETVDNLKKENDKEFDKHVKQVCRNYRQVSKHVLWSSRRLLANIRVKSA